jgi:acetyltransferase-like isoleucine patch superfamily enzyme
MWLVVRFYEYKKYQVMINGTNIIHESAIISPNVIMGNYNIINKGVIIQSFKSNDGFVHIGDCNIFNENTRVLAGPDGIHIGDWNVFHNDMLIMGEKIMSIGHNCWFGQNTILDSSGELYIENGVRVGMYSQIWTHVASGELIEGCLLYGNKPTRISEDVWLVGSCIVSSGIKLGKKSIYLSGSNITKSTDDFKVYAGSPAREMEKLNFYKSMHIDEKFDLMKKWVSEFLDINKQYNVTYNNDSIHIGSINNDKIVIFKEVVTQPQEFETYFCLKTKKYTKKLSSIERHFYKYIYNHKARFLPV